MIRSTPRITYRIGTRAGLGAVEDKSVPWLVSETPSIEVAADFTGILKFNVDGVPGGENHEFSHYESTSQNERLTRVWQANTRISADFAVLCPQVSLLLLRVINS
jgi:hypothetical protein